jgi:hypothetical protein
MSSSTAKVVVNAVDVRAEGSPQYITPRGHHGSSAYYEFDEQQESVLSDCAERDLVVYHLLRMVRDLYINSKSGGQGGAYRKQCKTRRRSALSAILSNSEDALSFRWSCRVLGFEPDVFRNRVLFDVQSISDLMREGVRICEGRGQARQTIINAEAWLWEEAPPRYQLSEKRGHYIVKMTQADAQRWTNSLSGSFLDFAVESFELTSGHTILILRLK